MTENLIKIIEHGSESAQVDFKLREYPLGKDSAKKNELLKDICAMANLPSDDPKYIIIGVKEEGGKVSELVGVETPTDQAKYQQFIDSNLEPRMNFEYITFDYKGCTLTAFVIEGNQQRPYLFKKELKRPTEKKVEYRVGDGFIRSGTSTRKLSRKDFEDIYARRQQARDRKSDLKITRVVKELDLLGMFKYGLYTIDFTIENLSSKSIGFDAELQLYIEEGTFVNNAIVYLYKLDREQGMKNTYPQYFPDKADEIPQYVEIERRSNYFKVVRIKTVNEKYALNIPQQDTNENIFSTDVLMNIPFKILNYRNTTVTAKLFLRSDDFKGGPIEKEFKFNLGNM